MFQLIVNADDFGYSKGVNLGILEAHLNGIVTSATIMTNMPGFDHAVELAKQHPTLRVGIHLVLTCGKPVSTNVSTLVDEKGDFLSLSYVKEHRSFSLDDVKREWRAQIQRFLATGLIPSHFDSHHHVHTLPELLPVVQELSALYKLPVRSSTQGPLPNVIPYSNVFVDTFYASGLSEKYFDTLANRPDLQGKIVEIMTHPAFLDGDILRGSSYTIDRVKEVELLTNVTMPPAISLL